LGAGTIECDREKIPRKKGNGNRTNGENQYKRFTPLAPSQFRDLLIVRVGIAPHIPDGVDN